MELLVRIVDKPHPADHPRDKAAKLGKRGFVIAAKPDGFAWSPIERTHREWVIIRTTITTLDAEGLMTPELGDPATHILRWRGFRLDLTALGIGTTRSAEIVSLPRNSVRSARTQLSTMTR